MNISAKKNIAKEIIYFFSLLLCTAIIWTVVELRNNHLKNEQYKILKSIERNNSKIDSLNKLNELPPIRMKQLVENLTEMFENGATDKDGEKYSKDFSEKFKNKSITDKLIYLSDAGKKLKIDKQKNQQKFINNDLSNGFTIMSFWILISVLYPIRIIFYIIKWAIKTLKNG